MSHTYAKKGNRLYRYYMCVTKMKRGRDAGPTPSLPAQEIEDFVVNEIRKLARDPVLQSQVLDEVVRQQRKLIPKLEKEQKRLQRELQAKREEMRRLATAIGASKEPLESLTSRLAAIETTAAKVETRLAGIVGELTATQRAATSPIEISKSLMEFDAVWESMHPQEHTQLVNSVVHAIQYTDCGEAMVLLKSAFDELEAHSLRRH